MDLYAEELSNSVQSIELSCKEHSLDTDSSLEKLIEQNIQKEVSPIMPAGYDLSYCLSEGATGKVFLVVNNQTKDCLAAKVVCVTGTFANSLVNESKKYQKAFAEKQRRDSLRHEVSIHVKLKHPNIAAAYSIRNTTSFAIMFMELLTGGDLFERIPIDVGLHIQQMFLYYSQMIDALDYLHNQQLIAHLDIKPENIMLTKKDRVKLIDFGWAVDLKINPKLRGPVGTKIYAAPEVWSDYDYFGPAADLFSLGVTLATAVSGQRLWSTAELNTDKIYTLWVERRSAIYDIAPFNRFPADFVNFLTRILSHDPTDRINIQQIKKHPWFQRGVQRRLTPIAAPNFNQIDHGLVSDKENLKNFNYVPQSQPIISHAYNTCQSSVLTQIGINPKMMLSQPLDTESMLLATQVNPDSSHYDGSKRVKVAHLLRRMTRFFTSLLNEKHTMEVIRAIIVQHSCLRMTVRGHCNLLVEIRQPELPLTVFRVILYRLSGSIMVDCRRVSGDGLLFHRIYSVLFEELKQMGAVNENHPYLAMVHPENSNQVPN